MSEESEEYAWRNKNGILLSVRPRNVLKAMGFRNWKGVVYGISSGAFNIKTFMWMKNSGKKSVREIYSWAGYTEKVCPTCGRLIEDIFPPKPSKPSRR